MSSGKIQKLKKIFTASGGCGCGQKSTDVIEPKPKPRTSFSDQKSSHYPSSSDSSWNRRPGGGKSTADDEDCTSTTFSLNIDASPHVCPDPTKLSETVCPCPKIQDSFAVVKDSVDPYQDFRLSMLQMICGKEIYARDDLQQLLDCFLKLNSPHHHGLIVRAFMEICNGGTASAGDGGGAAETPPCSSTVFT